MFFSCEKGSEGTSVYEQKVGGAVDRRSQVGDVDIDVEPGESNALTGLLTSRLSH